MMTQEDKRLKKLSEQMRSTPLGLEKYRPTEEGSDQFTNFFE